VLGVLGLFLQLLGFIGFHGDDLLIGWGVGNGLFPLPADAVFGIFYHDALLR
jgi:hypothetical protein